MSNPIKISTNEEDINIRIDKLLSDYLEDVSRSYLQKLITDELVLVNGKKVKSNYKINKNDVIEVFIPEPENVRILEQKIDINIVYEDKDVIIVDKEQGMVVHPAPGNYENTLVNAILYHCKDLSGINGVLRPGIVHRIDKDTSGLLIVCKNDKSHNDIAKQLKEHTVIREYEAIVFDNIKEEQGTVDAPIGRHPVHRKQMAINHKNGKRAITHYSVIGRSIDNKYTYVKLKLETGRTHQIRVHMASIHHPLVGDLVYGPNKNPFKLEGQLLHAKKIGFIHPTTKEYMEFSSELPNYFKDLINKINIINI